MNNGGGCHSERERVAEWRLEKKEEQQQKTDY
jgi:hypothetical protein